MFQKTHKNLFQYRTSPFILIGLISFFVFIPAIVYGHVGFGEYAGTHVVAFVPEPRSPFVGEEVEMTFYLRDLHGARPSEPFIVGMTIQEVSPDYEEKIVFATPPETIVDGVYKTSYIFTKPHDHYRVEFSFNKPDEPEILRDAIFDLQVREITAKETSSASPITLVFIALISFLAGILVRQYYKK